MISAPISQGMDVSNVGQFRVFSAPSHQEWGSGTRVAGSSYMTSVLKNIDGKGFPVGTNYVFLTGTTSNGWILPVHPWNIDRGAGSRLKVIGGTFSRYAIRALRWRYVPSTTTTETGSVAFGYTTDPNYFFRRFATAPPIIADITEFQPNILLPYWGTNSFGFTYNGPNTWLWGTESNSEDQPDLSQICQGAIGVGSTTSASDEGLVGFMLCDYVVDFYSPVPYNSPNNSLTPSIPTGVQSVEKKGIRLPARLCDEKKSFACAVGSKIDPPTSVPSTDVTVGHTISLPTKPKQQLFYRTAQGDFEEIPDDESS